MESIKLELARNEKETIYQKIVLSILKRFQKGELRLTLPNGEMFLIGNGGGLKVDLQILNNDFFRKFVLYGDIGFGEAYCAGDWTTSNLTDLVRWAIQNVETSGVMSGSKVKEFSVNLLGQLNKAGHFFRRNNHNGSKSNISYHYDLGNNFYQMILDETMSYSCGIFGEDQQDLYQAQLNKLETLCNDLDIRPGDHILEIGCGWGGFATYAVTHFDCKVTGITISKEQFNFATEKVKKLGLEDKITILFMDYRDLTGQFDKVVSVEMIEAVGHEYLPQYFATIDRLLKKEGVAVIQAITSPDSRYDSFRKSVDFIQKHIFPGSLLPSVGAMTEACKKGTTLQLHNLRDIGLHYANTLRLWRERMHSNRKAIQELGMNDTFFRTWDYYFSYCEAAFIERNISDVQVTYIKPNNTTYKNYKQN